MKPRVFLAVLAAVVASSVASSAEPPPLHFLSPALIDFKAVLPPPPAPGSISALGDLETVLRVQAGRDGIQVAWAKFIERESVFNYSQLLGSWFAKDKLPATDAFFREVTEDVNTVNHGAKDLYPRQRPFAVDPAVNPVVSRPVTNSYPSGHSMRAFAWALVLGDIFPEHQAELVAWAHQIAWGRVIGGVHFPTDTVGGRLVAEAIVAELRKSPAYRAGIEKCRAEAAPYLLKKAA